LQKAAKTLAPVHPRWLNVTPYKQKFFGSFFQKRTACSGNLAIKRAHASRHHFVAAPHRRR
jgi:hypothetical protein